MRDLKKEIFLLEQKLASAPPSVCAPLVRRLVQRKRMFLRLPAPPRGR